MTHEEELALLEQCTNEVMRKYTDDKPVVMVMLTLFHETKHIHCTTNMAAGQEGVNWMLNHYLGNAPLVPPRRESVWLLLKGSEVDGVSRETVVSVHSTKAAAQAALARQPEATQVAWNMTEEYEVDANG